MIDLKKYLLILNEGLLLDHYLLLKSIKEGSEPIGNKRVQGFLNLLYKKGYIDEGNLTSKALAILEGDGTPIIEVSNIRESKAINEMLSVKEPSLKFDYASWIIALHRKCEAKLIEKTGKRQIRDKIDGKPYSFLPNSTDLGRVILKAVNTYKLKDFDKIETTILKYIDRCSKANKWFPILAYYIMKNSMSPMVTDMDSDEEEGNNSASIHIV